MCDIGLTLVLYRLLRPVREDLALLAVFFRLVSTAVFAIAELFYFAASLILGGAGYLKTFSPEQLNSLALLSLKLSGYGGGIFMLFYNALLLGDLHEGARRQVASCPRFVQLNARSSATV